MTFDFFFLRRLLVHLQLTGKCSTNWYRRRWKSFVGWRMSWFRLFKFLKNLKRNDWSVKRGCCKAYYFWLSVSDTRPAVTAPPRLVTPGIWQRVWVTAAAASWRPTYPTIYYTTAFRLWRQVYLSVICHRQQQVAARVTGRATRHRRSTGLTRRRTCLVVLPTTDGLLIFGVHLWLETLGATRSNWHQLVEFASKILTNYLLVFRVNDLQLDEEEGKGKFNLKSS